MTWQLIGTAPKDGTSFWALNKDGELWVARYFEEERIAFRFHQLRVSTSHEVIKLGDGREARVENMKRHKETWEDRWTLWTRGYEFDPTHWTAILPLPVISNISGD